MHTQHCTLRYDLQLKSLRLQHSFKNTAVYLFPYPCIRRIDLLHSRNIWIQLISPATPKSTDSTEWKKTVTRCVQSLIMTAFAIPAISFFIINFDSPIVRFCYNLLSWERTRTGSTGCLTCVAWLCRPCARGDKSTVIATRRGKDTRENYCYPTVWMYNGARIRVFAYSSIRVFAY